MRPLPPVVSFVAPSGTGKTSFLERLIPALSARGLRVLVIKHDVHRFDVDQPGKDTHRLTAAGAHRVLIANREKFAVLGALDGEVPLRTLIERYGDGIDLVITEGYRSSAMPKILVSRAGATPKRPWDAGALAGIAPLVAVVCDAPVTLPAPHADVPRLPLADAPACATFLTEQLFAKELGPQAPRAVTGVLLAGGRSSRMGTDKARLVVDGAALLPALSERLSEVCDGGVLVVRRSGQELPALPPAVRVVEDLLPDLGPLGGLLTGLAAATTPFVFLAACDMPRLDQTLIRWLIDHPCRADVLLPQRDGHAEPVHALYGARCLGAIKEAVLSGELGMGSWLGSVRVQRVAEEEWRRVHPTGDSFLNVNTPEDLARIER